MGLARLAELHGVATAYAPSPGTEVRVPDATVVAVLAALGVDAATPAAIAAGIEAAEHAAAGRLLPPTVVSWAAPEGSGPGRHRADWAAGLPTGTRLTVRLEGGGTEHGTHLATQDAPPAAAAPGDGVPASAPGDGVPVPLPLGVHRVEARAPDGRSATATLVVAPARAPQPGTRTYGFLVQLYSLLSRRSWGMGDLGDLAELASWAGRELGAGFVQINPLHAAVPGHPTDPSPYRPSSRRFPDPVHLRIEDVPEYAYVTGPDRARLDALAEKAAGLRTAVLDEGAPIDRDAVWELKREALTVLCGVDPGPGRHAAYRDFLAAQGGALDDHATWCALAEVHGTSRAAWPPELRDPRSPETRAARAELAERVEFHRRAAWLTDEQLGRASRAALEAGMGVGIVHDLAVGVHPDGSDTWAQHDVFARGISVGAPPDAFNSLGQDWGLPPWRPDALAATGYAAYRGLLRGLLRHAGALRIDHVMGLFRLWWIPEAPGGGGGGDPTRGTYVRYDANALLAVLVLEAHRAGAVVVGEDLGTVEPGVREELARRGILGTSVLWFERHWDRPGQPPLAPTEWRSACVATATTHDLPSTAARLTGEHVALRDRLGLLSRPLAEEQAEDRAEIAGWLRELVRLGLLPDSAARGVGAAEAEQQEEDEIRAVHRFLLRTSARLVGVWLPDTVGDRRPQNVPGTSDQYPNWRLPLADATGRPTSLEELASSPRLRRLMEGVREAATARTAPPAARPA